MRISEIIITEKFEEEEILSKHCHNCRQLTLEFHLESNPHNKMFICITKNCFLYTDITKLITWIQ